MCLSPLVYAANKVYHPTVTQPFWSLLSRATPDSYQGKLWAGKEPKTPSGCRPQGISGIQDLVVLQNSQLTVRNLFHLVQNQTPNPSHPALGTDSVPSCHNLCTEPTLQEVRGSALNCPLNALVISPFLPSSCGDAHDNN